MFNTYITYIQGFSMVFWYLYPTWPAAFKGRFSSASHPLIPTTTHRTVCAVGPRVTEALSPVRPRGRDGKHGIVKKPPSYT